MKLICTPQGPVRAIKAPTPQTLNLVIISVIIMIMIMMVLGAYLFLRSTVSVIARARLI